MQCSERQAGEGESIQGGKGMGRLHIRNRPRFFECWTDAVEGYFTPYQAMFSKVHTSLDLLIRFFFSASSIVYR